MRKRLRRRSAIERRVFTKSKKKPIFSKQCQFCPRGTFQDLPQQTTCKACPLDHSQFWAQHFSAQNSLPDFSATASAGATHASQCYSTNQCATGDDNCSWHAVCVDLPDLVCKMALISMQFFFLLRLQNDVPRFECRCKPGFRGLFIALARVQHFLIVTKSIFHMF